MSILRAARIVHWGDCAPSGAVVYPVYFRWFDEATWSLFKSLGLPLDSLGARYGVIGLPLASNSCDYKRPCRLGDGLDIETAVTAIDDSFVVLRHRIFNAEHLAVIGSGRRFWGVRHPQDPRRLQKGQIPPEVAHILLRAVASNAAADGTP